MANDFVGGFTFIGDRWSDPIQDFLLEHITVSAEAIGIAIVIGLPLGAFLGHLHRFSFLAINTSNLARAIPSLALLAILLPYTGVDDATIIIMLVVLAAPPILTNSYVAVDQVDPDTVDAAKGIGLRPWQVLTKVELPLALPLIFAGIRTAAVFVVATETLQGFFGSGGLGNIIGDPASYGLPGVVGASYVLIALAFVVQILFLVLEYFVTPTGLRRRPGSKLRRPTGGQPGSGAAPVPDEAATGAPDDERVPA